MRLHRKTLKITIAIVCLITLAGLITVIYYLQSQPRSTNKTTPKNVLTAHGIPVPQNLTKRAKSAGYYCPSWNAKKGAIVSTICYPLDK